MKKQKRYLITTADEATWKFDRPVIFLNEWCCLNNRKHIWDNLEAEVLEPYVFETLEQKIDFHESTNNVYDKILPELCDILNNYHNTNYNSRFWLILIGPWLKNTIRLIINRAVTLKKCFQIFEITGNTTYENDSISLISSDFLSGVWCFRNDKWNSIFNYKILNLLKDLKLSTEFLNDKSDFNFYEILNTNLIEKKNSSLQKILEHGKNIYSKIAQKFIRKNDAFIINSYLPPFEEIKLELSLGQCPQLWKFNWNKLTFPKITKVPDQALRDVLKKKITCKSDYELENIVRSLLFELLPTCYLEGFLSLNEVVEGLPWPKTPKFIFTSNNYSYDEVFKLWVAKQVDSGKKYYIGQHGNNLGTRWDLIDCIEEVTSDKFLTWGWKDDQKKHLPAFLFKTAGKKKQNYNNKGSLLLIETSLSQSIYFDKIKELKKYFINQKIFVNRLAEVPREELIIRLYRDGNQHKNIWDEETRWSEFDSKLKIDKSTTNLNSLILNARIVVHSYDSTSMLETLSQNIPTLAFWENKHDNVKKSNGFDHLREKVKPNYQMLVDAGIIHLTPESAADKVNEIWNDINGWWFQSHIQNVRKQFCDNFAKKSQNPISELKKILLS